MSPAVPTRFSLRPGKREARTGLSDGPLVPEVPWLHQGIPGGERPFSLTLHIVTASSNEGWSPVLLLVVISTGFSPEDSQQINAGSKCSGLIFLHGESLLFWKTVTNTSVTNTSDKICLLQTYILINSKTEVNIHIKNIGITSQRPFLPPFCSQSHLKLIVTEACSLFPPRQIKVGSLESFSVVEGGLFSTIGYAGVYVAD